MDRFHRRLLWPIRSSAGEVIGFGARRLFDDDPMEAKYVNTPETLLYKKSSVLFGIDLAKRDIAKGHQAVVVEGYTDVMAMHLAGVTTAVASCGTAFGDEHLAMLRRLMMDDNFFRGELIYVFDGDEAGRAAALKAFAGEQHLAGQSFVAVAADGMDPCDLRLASGDGALRDLVARRTPLFEFAIRTALSEMDLDSAEGRVAALRRCVPMVAQIKDPTLRDEYARQLAGWVGWSDVAQVIGRVREEAKNPTSQSRAASPVGPPQPRPTPARPTSLRLVPTPTTPRCGRSARRSSRRLQYPALAGPVFDALTVESFTHPGYAAVCTAIEAAGGTGTGIGGAEWLDAVRQKAPSPAAAGLISELGVESHPGRRRREAAALHRRGAGPSAGGVGRPADRGGQVQTAAHVAGGAGRRVSRPVRRPGRDGGLSAQPAGAGQRRRSHCLTSSGCAAWRLAARPRWSHRRSRSTSPSARRARPDSRPCAVPPSITDLAAGLLVRAR